LLKASIICAFTVLACIQPTAFAQAANVSVSVQANTLKPLVLARVQDLNLGSITLGPGTWSNATVSISQAGVLSCTNANVTCTGATQVAKYNVQGSKQDDVQISAPNITLVNQSDSSQTLTLIVSSPSSLTLPNSGQPGVDFSIGGSVTLNSTVSGGTYVGTFNVTVDY